MQHIAQRWEDQFARPQGAAGRAFPCIMLFFYAGLNMEAERINAIAGLLSDLDARARELRRYL